MSFGRELQDFVNGFQGGWRLVNQSREVKARADAWNEKTRESREKNAYVNSAIAEGEKQPLPSMTARDTTATPQPLETPATSTKPVNDQEVVPQFRRGGRMPMPWEAGGERFAIPEDETAYTGGEDETFQPIGDTVREERPSAPAPTRALRRGALPEYPPERDELPSARSIVGDNPGRGGPPRPYRDPDQTAIDIGRNARMERSLRRGVPTPDSPSAIGAADIVGQNPGRGGAPYPTEPYRTGTEEGPYDRGALPVGSDAEAAPATRTSEVPTPAVPVDGPTPAKPAGRPGGGTGGARPKPAGRTGGNPPAGAVDEMLVSEQEIRANNMTPQQVTELNEARKAARRMSASRGEDPNANIQRRPLAVSPEDGYAAVDSAVGFLTKQFGIGSQAGALPMPSDRANTGQGLRRLLMGDGAASPQEVRAVEGAVDPNGELSRARRVMLALGATHRYYLEHGDPVKAKRAAASLLQYYQLNASRLGAIARSAYEAGDVTGAVKAATEAYNMTPDGKELEAKVDPRGIVKYRVSDIATGKPVAQGQGPAGQLLGQALQNANPLSYLQQAAGVRAAGRSGGGGGRKAAGPSAAGGDPGAEAEYRKAMGVLNNSDASDEDKAAAKEAARAAYDKLFASTSVGRGKGDSSRTYALGARGITHPDAARPGGATPAGKGDAKERATAQADASMTAINEADTRLANTMAGVKKDRTPAVDTSMPRSESTATEVARRSNKVPDASLEEMGAARGQFDAQRADIGYKRAPGRKEFDNANKYGERITPYNEAYDSVLKEGRIDDNGQVDPRQERKVEPNQRRAFMDIVDRVAAKNDVNPETVVRVLDSMANNIRGPAPQVDPRTGAVVYNGQRFIMDGQSLAQLAAMRGAAVKKYRDTLALRQRETEQMNAQQAQQAEQDRALRGRMRDQIEGGSGRGLRDTMMDEDR